jgi:hypothetical protein
MKLRTLGCAAALGLFAVAPVRGAIVITEICFNEVGSTANGEWIEIYNTGPSTVDLSNYKIGDEEQSGGTSTTEALFKFPAGATIASGEIQIISGGAARFFTVYGFNPTYETAEEDATVPRAVCTTP